ncbi:MAG: PAS domain S-box protein, partial [Armatimonadetes bacterium]|nr:PAS domain S-box protein [Anaerolineae bacterium]
MLSSDYLNNILMSMAGSLIVVGPDMKIKTINQATRDLTGWTESDLLGQTIDVVLETGMFNSPKDILGRHGFVRHGERIYKTQDGRQIPVSFSSAIMRDEHKRVQGIVCVAQDISSHKQLEAELNDRVHQLGLLAQVDEELTHHLNIDHVISLGLDIVLRLSRAEAGMIALLDESGKLSVKQSLGYPATV